MKPISCPNELILKEERHGAWRDFVVISATNVASIINIIKVVN